MKRNKRKQIQFVHKNNIKLFSVQFLNESFNKIANGNSRILFCGSCILDTFLSVSYIAITFSVVISKLKIDFVLEINIVDNGLNFGFHKKIPWKR